MGKKSIVIGAFLLFFLAAPTSFAQTNTLFPAVAAGPGFFLPDNPLYVLDKLFQEAKLVAAFYPERRALVRTQIIGERMAELRVMHARGSSSGIDIALSEISKEAEGLSEDFREAALSGKDLSEIAKSINDSLRINRLALSQASQNLDEVLSLKLDSASQTLLLAKVDVEEFLNPLDMEEAVQNDLDDEIESAVLGVSTKAEGIEKKIEKLQAKASRAAELEAKRAALEEQKEAKKAEAKELKEKRKKLREERKRLLEERKKKLEAAREVFKKAREAALKFKESQKTEDDLRETEISPTPTPEP